MARRRYQKGSVAECAGKWIGRWREDVRLPDGTVKRINRKRILGDKDDFKTKREVQRSLDLILAPINSLDYRPTVQITFGEFVRRWMDAVMPHAYKISSMRETQNQVKYKLLPAFSTCALKDITTPDIQAFISSLATKGLSAKYVRNVVSTMSTTWKTAMAWKYVSHNPFEGIVLPQVGKPASRVYSLQETMAIFTAAPEPLKTFIWLAAETGLRPGEVCGLDWRNVDLKAGVIRVCQSAWRGRLVAPKTQAGFREVAISSQLVSHLFRDARNEGLLFQYENGRPWREEKVREKKLNPLLDKLGIERKGLHAFRHFNATEMDRRNIPMKTRQERLGHSDPRITMGMRNRSGYTHMVSEDDRNVAQVFGSILCPSCVQNEASAASA